ncbi:MAG: hypothetical protein ACPGQL_06975 [Thermoplasmatota archaeon]
MRIPATLLLLLAAGLAGCLSDDDPAPADEPSQEVAAAATHVLAGAVEPTGFETPTFNVLGAIASGGPVYGAGEPSIWAHTDGTLYVAFPGCDEGFYLASLPTDEGSCEHGIVYGSTDDGATWERLNRAGDGRYTEEGPSANGDADVTVDSEGTVWVSNLGNGIQFHRYDPPTGEWTYIANVVPPEEGADRQWLAAAGPGHVIHTWMRTSPNRDVAINTTFDGGKTWTGAQYFGDNIGWLGTVQFAPDGRTAYIPYTQPQGDGLPLTGDGGTCAMHVVKTTDGGVTWNDIDTGARWPTMLAGTHWSCVHMAPALDVTGDGTVVVAWSRDVDFLAANGVADANIVPAAQMIEVITSPDGGANWTEPYLFATFNDPAPNVSTQGAAIMPWVTGGAGDRYAITFLHSLVFSGDQDYTGNDWDLEAIFVDGDIAGGNVTQVTLDQSVHQGGICTRGGLCLLSGSDRALLDFFESDLLPDGRLAVTYPADPLTGGKFIEVRVAIQDGGTPLLERPGAATTAADEAP